MSSKPDAVLKLKTRLQAEINRLGFLDRMTVVKLQHVIGREIDDFAEEYGDPFKPLSDSLGPTFDRITRHEEELAEQIGRIKEIVERRGKEVYDPTPQKPVTVRSQSRVTLSEFEEGTVLDKRVYRSKHAYPCPTCDGTGRLEDGTACSECGGSGEHHPIRGVMLEVL